MEEWLKKKKKEWSLIEKEFNSRHGVHKRTILQLKALLKNLKSRAKTGVAKERREKKKLAGVPQEKMLTKFRRLYAICCHNKLKVAGIRMMTTQNSMATMQDNYIYVYLLLQVWNGCTPRLYNIV